VVEILHALKTSCIKNTPSVSRIKYRFLEMNFHAVNKILMQSFFPNRLNEMVQGPCAHLGLDADLDKQELSSFMLKRLIKLKLGMY
jgi:hypothetical protein